VTDRNSFKTNRPVLVVMFTEVKHPYKNNKILTRHWKNEQAKTET